MDLKNNRRGSISEYADAHEGVTFTASAPEPTPNGLWGVKRRCCATMRYTK